MIKKNVAILFGGQSSEHQISKISASSIIRILKDIKKYNIVLIYITECGQWKIYDGELSKLFKSLSQGLVKEECKDKKDSNNNNNSEELKDNIIIDWEQCPTAIISPDTSHKGIVKINNNNSVEFIHVDVVIPVIHGKGGEDGTIQGLLELAELPYVGCGVLSSSVCMDKAYTKIIVDSIGIKQAKYTSIQKHEVEAMFNNNNNNNNNNSIQDFFDNTILKNIGIPCYIKPANAGSSKGITKANSFEEFLTGLQIAILHDNRVVIEENIVGKEVECGVIGNYDITASRVGQVLSATQFYDFEAKYNNNNSKTVIPASIDNGIASEIQESAKKIFKALNCRGLSRVDFFVEDTTNKVIFNEINTFPGFTPISMYPMLLKDIGFEIEELLEKLIDLAIEEKNFKTKVE